MTKLSKQAQELYDRYANSGAPAESKQPQFQLSVNGRARAQEMVQRSGMTREQARQDPAILKAATLKALAEQQGQPEANIGVNGRNGLNGSTQSVRTGRSLSDMANNE